MYSAYNSGTIKATEIKQPDTYYLINCYVKSTGAAATNPHITAKESLGSFCTRAHNATRCLAMLMFWEFAVATHPWIYIYDNVTHLSEETHREIILNLLFLLVLSKRII